MSGADDPFFAHIGPLRDALAEMVDVSSTLRHERGNLPDAGSRAMAELAEEPALVGAWGQTPVMSAYSTATLAITACEDHATAICRLLAGDPVPTWAHSTLARAALEASARAFWLLELDIGAHRRVARYMTYRIADQTASAALADAVGEPTEASNARARARMIVDEADRLGFAATRSRKGAPRAIGEPMPGPTQLVRNNLRDGDPESDDLGTIAYRGYSAIAHAQPHGLMQGIDADRDSLTPAGLMTGALVTRSNVVNGTLTAVALGYGHAVGELAALFGWTDAEWRATCARVFAIARDVLPPA